LAMVVVPMVLAMVCSASADASCGDYLHSRRSPDIIPQSSPQLPEANVVTAMGEGQKAPGPIAPASRPCSGPACGKSPLSIPVPVPIADHGSSADQYPAIFHRPRCESPSGKLLPRPCSHAHPEPGFPLPIDVPPELFL
jgi:hypothetical protein